MKGQVFAGWGYMRFWLKAQQPRGANAQHSDLRDGEGSTGEFPGAIESASWRQPYRGTLVSMGAMPQRVHSH